jgi:hypothetical protein
MHGPLLYRHSRLSAVCMPLPSTSTCAGWVLLFSEGGQSRLAANQRRAGGGLAQLNEHSATLLPEHVLDHDSAATSTIEPPSVSASASASTQCYRRPGTCTIVRETRALPSQPLSRRLEPIDTRHSCPTRLHHAQQPNTAPTRARNCVRLPHNRPPVHARKVHDEADAALLTASPCVPLLHVSRDAFGMLIVAVPDPPSRQVTWHSAPFDIHSFAPALTFH